MLYDVEDEDVVYVSTSTVPSNEIYIEILSLPNHDDVRY